MSVSGPKKEEYTTEFGVLRDHIEGRIGPQSIRIQLRYSEVGLCFLRSRAKETAGLFEGVS